MYISVKMSPGIFRNQVLIAMQFTNDLASGATKNTLCQVVLAVAKNLNQKGFWFWLRREFKECMQEMFFTSMPWPADYFTDISLWSTDTEVRYYDYETTTQLKILRKSPVSPFNLHDVYVVNVIIFIV